MRPELLEPGHRLRARRLDRVADGERRVSDVVPGDGDAAVPAPDLDRVPVDDAGDADARDVAEAAHRRKLSELRLRRLGDRSRNRVLDAASTAPASRSTRCETPSIVVTSASSIFPR